MGRETDKPLELVKSFKGRNAVADELRDRIVAGLHVGRLRGEDRLPPVRMLALELGVNERVVLAALRLLREAGFIELRPRSGAYVVVPQPPTDERTPQLAAWLIGMLSQARARGLPPREVSELVHRSLETRRVRAACIECNHDQLHLLCSELAGDHGYATEPVPLDELDAEHPSPAVQRADVLVTTAFHSSRVGRVAQALNKPWISVGLRPEIMRGVARHLERGPVYYVATDPRFERKLRLMLAPFGTAENLRMVLVPRDDLSGVPAGAPMFVMTSAREQLRRWYGDSSGPGQPIHPVRHLSDEASRQLLGFLVRTNLQGLEARG